MFALCHKNCAFLYCFIICICPNDVMLAQSKLEQENPRKSYYITQSLGFP